MKFSIGQQFKGIYRKHHVIFEVTGFCHTNDNENDTLVALNIFLTRSKTNRQDVIPAICFENLIVKEIKPNNA